MCVRAKQRGKAMALLAEMGQKGLGANVIAYNAAISAVELAEQPHEIMELLAVMLQKVLGATRDHLHAAISAC